MPEFTWKPRAHRKTEAERLDLRPQDFTRIRKNF